MTSEADDSGGRSHPNSPPDSSPSSSHCVAVIGGAVSGAEMAGTLARQGVTVVVFEQNPRPYGKIEDGLPRWHHRLRDKEYKAIREKLSREAVHYVPNTRIGRDVDFADLVNSWGFSAVVLANGAWRDRPLPLDGADDFVGKGLIYQNPFVTWFNHLEEADYDGPGFDILDGTIVVGGGLASIDVAKIVMLETTRAALARRGIEEDMIALEVKGIPKVLSSHGLVPADLGLEGCTIFYRRRIEDMPVASAPEDATPEQEARVLKSRASLIEKATRKFGFKIVPLAAPDSLIVENGRLAGLVFRRTKIDEGRVVMTDETFEQRGSCVISSIGSIPEKIPGIDMKGELFDFCDWDLGRLAPYPTVFAAGNVVTGKGNIAASRKHAIHVAQDAVEAFLGLGEEDADGEFAGIANPRVAQAHETAKHIASQLAETEAPDPAARDEILRRVKQRQQAVGYPDDFATWLNQVEPKPR
jgi:ferredoxin--NADP+ reductase